MKFMNGEMPSFSDDRELIEGAKKMGIKALPELPEGHWAKK